MGTIAEVIKVGMNVLAYCQALGILFVVVFGACQMLRKEDHNESERALFRSKSWPSEPGRDVFSTGIAGKLLKGKIK